MRRTSTWTIGCACLKRAMIGSTACTEASLAPIEHAPAAQVAQVADRAFGFLGQAQQTLGVVTQQAAGLGEGGVLGRAVEQPLADTLLETADGLADSRLRPVQLHGCPGEAAFGGDLQKDA